MTSTAQVNANRANAQKSTGPRTAQGKAVAAQNAVRHGLLAKEVVIKGEDPGEFEFYREQMLAELAPAGQMESMLAQRIVGLSWRLRRAERLQTAAFDKVEDQKEPEPAMPPELASKMLALLAESNWHPPVPAVPAFGRRAVQDFSLERVLDRMLVYERRIESSLYRTMAELRKLRKEGGTASSMGVPPMTVEDSAFGVPVPPMNEPDPRAGLPCALLMGGTPMLLSRKAVLRTGAGTNRAKRTQLTRELQVGSRKSQARVLPCRKKSGGDAQPTKSRRKAGVRANRAKRTQSAPAP